MTCRRPGCGHEFCWLCAGPWREHSGGCTDRRYSITRGSQQHFAQLNKEATSYIVAARLARDHQAAILTESLMDPRGAPCPLSHHGRRVAKLRHEAWGRVKAACELLYGACVSTYFVPSGARELAERLELERDQLNRRNDQVQEALEREMKVDEDGIPGGAGDPLVHDP
jgi:hypothetical protein